MVVPVWVSDDGQNHLGLDAFDRYDRLDEIAHAHLLRSQHLFLGVIALSSIPLGTARTFGKQEAQMIQAIVGVRMIVLPVVFLGAQLFAGTRPRVDPVERSSAEAVPTTGPNPSVLTS
jgi:hypothetical protein